MSVTLRVNIRGTNLWIKQLRSSQPLISKAQQEVGIKNIQKLRDRAKQIIEQDAPKTSGRLAHSLHIIQNKTAGAAGNGWHTRLTTDVPYAKKVESGHGPERIVVSDEVLDWIGRVLGPEVQKKWAAKGTRGRRMTVRKGNNPRYDTGRGMGFFRIPFEENKDTIAADMEAEVQRLLSKMR